MKKQKISCCYLVLPHPVPSLFSCKLNFKYEYIAFTIITFPCNRKCFTSNYVVILWFYIFMKMCARYTEHVTRYSKSFGMGFWNYDTALLTNVLFISGWTSLHWDGVGHKPSCSSTSGTVYNKISLSLLVSFEDCQVDCWSLCWVFAGIIELSVLPKSTTPTVAFPAQEYTVKLCSQGQKEKFEMVGAQDSW